MALRFVKDSEAKGIVAIACPEELRMGVEAVTTMNEHQNSCPAIVIVPLTKDGCVDTQVDAGLVLRAIRLGSRQ